MRVSGPGPADRAGRAGFAIVLLAGIILRVWQLLENAPLWLDELALANGVLAGPLSGLFDGASDFAQVAPPGFLALEWLLANVAPQSDLVLRLPAFVFSIGGIWFTWLAARELIGERLAWVPAGLVALPAQVVLMSGQVKPYAADLLFSTVILAAVLVHDRQQTTRSLVRLTVAGAIAPLFSLGAVFVLAGGGVFLLTHRGRNVAWRDLMLVATGWVVGALVAVMLTSRLLNPATDALMNNYWKDAFPPIPRSLSDAAWPFRVIDDILWSLMGFRAVTVVAIAIAIGVIVAWRRRPALALLLVAPIAAAFVAALLHRYPFGARVMHWAVPLFALLLTLVVFEAGKLIGRRWRLAPLALGAIALAGPSYAVASAPPPYVRDDIRPVLFRLSWSSQPGDAIYLYWGAWHSWSRYGDGAGKSATVIQGGCPVSSPRGYLHELDQLRGVRQAWVLFARVEDEDVQRVMLDYLAAIGTPTDSTIVAQPGLDFSTRMSLYRFDLSDVARLTSTSAERFPIAPELVRTEAGCPDIDAMMIRGDGSRAVPISRN